jgi:SWI/SNF-related matrix-associated actin-dependent regulator of chromatin subfamily E protein 1
MHQKKLESELQQLEEKYSSKKRHLRETSDEFGKELKRHCEQPVDESKFKEMINEQVG